MVEITDNFFDLSEDQESMSKMIYNNKIIKCIVAPYHSYAQLESVVPFTKTTFLFPEREMTNDQTRTLISMIVQNPSTEEFRIVTANQNIIIDMINDCVRILTEGGSLIPYDQKTFMANIHDIRYNILENKDHQLSDHDKTLGHQKINGLIQRMENRDTISQSEHDDILKSIESIGEPLISDALKGKLRYLTIIP